jgi:serine/threonine protein phosphatase PrpC
MSTIDERAVEVGHFSQPGLIQPQAELVGYFEPTQLADLNRHGRLLVVADGVGGATSGEVASRYAIQRVLHDFYHSREADLEKRLLAVIRQTNQAIFERNRRFPERRPIATTLLVALIHQNKLLVANVGDARAYVVWDQDIERLTSQQQPTEQAASPSPASPLATDNLIQPEIAPQSVLEVESPSQPGTPPALATTVGIPPVAAKMEAPAASVDPPVNPANGPQSEPPISLPPGPHRQPSAGTLTEPTRKTPTVPLENNTTRPTSPAANQPAKLPPLFALGLSEQIEIELFSRRLFAGDIVLLASGGLTGYVTETEIAQMVTQNPPLQASRRLAELAAKRGSRDTLAVSITKVLSKPVTQAAPARLALPLAPDWEALAKPITKPLPPLPALPERKIKEVSTPHRWPIYGAALLALLLIGLIGFWAGGFWLTPELGSTMQSQQQSGSSTEVSPASATAVNQAVPTEPVGPVTAATTPAQNNLKLQTEVTPATGIIEPISPLATPTASAIAQQTGDIITPTLVISSPTPIPTIAIPAGCENKARFAGDLTVSDGTEFAAGEAFEKAWSVINYGSCPWGGGYTVRFKDGDIMGAAERIPLLTTVELEATGVVSIPMSAPDLPGTYRGNWQLFDLTGQPFGPDLYVEIKVVPGIVRLDDSQLTTLYDFILNATQARWTAGDVAYTVSNASIDRNLVIPAPQGIVVIGPTELRGNVASPANVLMTHPHQELGLIEGVYAVDVPLQSNDVLIGSLGLPKAAAINDDGVTFEVIFKPNGAADQLLLSKLVKYEESPVSIRQALTNIPPGQPGVFILRVKGGQSLSFDWATWIELRLVRP